MKLDLKTFSAPITVTGVAGDTIVDGFSSEIRLAEVAGPMRVKTFSGGVTLEARSWADGDDLNVNTFSGDVTLRLPDSARGRIDFDSYSGTFKSDLPVTLVVERPPQLPRRSERRRQHRLPAEDVQRDVSIRK